MTEAESCQITGRLSSFHARLIKQFCCFSEETLRTQYHPDLSQLGWHLNHIAFIEQYWLREVVLGDDSRTKDAHQNYFPEHIEKSGRGLLSELADTQQLQKSFSETEELWGELSTAGNGHELMQNNYLGWFLLQHGQQHLEIMRMVIQQRGLNNRAGPSFEIQPFDPAEIKPPDLFVAAGDYEIGSTEILACDNEQPMHTAPLLAYWIAARAVSNAEYLCFMQEQAYHRPEYWSDQGWLWLTESRKKSPEQWRQDDKGNWYELAAGVPTNINAQSTVTGLSWYEADAFARYTGCRLPHEFEWETVMKTDPACFASTGQAWEWCANSFFAYEGFTAFPYERYSSPWFDGLHYSLKGSSPSSSEYVRNPSFRNFYLPDKRHIFAGLRLASDG